MAANTCTSTTATVAGTDPSFTATYLTYNHYEGAMFYLKYTIGTTTSVTVTFTTIDPNLSATDQYKTVSLSGSTVTQTTYIFTAAGNYRIPVPLTIGEQKVIASVVFSGAGLDAAAVCNFTDN